MLRIVLLLVFSCVVVIHSVNSDVVMDITGLGLTLDNDTLPYEKKYSYTFKKPGFLNLTCSVSTLFPMDYLMMLGDERDYGRSRYATNETHLSLSYTFELTSKSRPISCIAISRKNPARFTITVDLKYEPDTTTAPSISISTEPTAPVPKEPTFGSAKPQNPATTKPTVPVPIEPTTGSAEPQTPGDSVKNIVIACLCIVIVLVIIIVIIRNRCFRTQVNPNKMSENIMSRPPVDLPPEVVYEEVYSHGAGLQRPRRQQARAAAPQHPLHCVT